MTGHACRRQFIAVEISRMARIALDLGMRPSQRIFRLVVIKMTGPPLVLIVTGLALGAVSSAMCVLNFVAIHALRPHTFVALSNVASRTHHGLVRALEREPRRVMVEFLDLAPRRFAVAILAFFAEPPLMLINGLVTIKTASRRGAQLYSWCMAARAG